MIASIINKIKRFGLRYFPKPLVSLIQKRRIVQYKAKMILFPKQTVLLCPCCGIKTRSFVSGPYANYPDRYNPLRYQNVKQDVLCPICWSLPRHRILSLWCNNNLVFLKRSDILYFAPEKSMTLWLDKKGVQYTPTSLSRPDIDLRLNIENTCLPDTSYDVIIANHVLEHVDDFRKALKEMYRILKPAGMFICSFPMDPKVELLDEEEKPLSSEERLRRFGQNDHKRVFGMNADQFLTEAGFNVEVIDGSNYPNEILPVVGPADYDMNILFCCRKPA